MGMRLENQDSLGSNAAEWLDLKNNTEAKGLNCSKMALEHTATNSIPTSGIAHPALSI